MAMPVNAMMLSQAMTDVKQCMSKIDGYIGDNKGQKAMEEIVTMQRLSVPLFEMLIVLSNNAAQMLTLVSDNVT